MRAAAAVFVGGGQVGQPSVRIWMREKRGNNVTEPELTAKLPSVPPFLSPFFFLLRSMWCPPIHPPLGALLAISQPSRRRIFSVS